MKHFISNTALLCLALLNLPGCGERVVDWAKEQCYQGCEVQQCLAQARCYLRSERIYDEFTLLGGFSVLWLSDQVRQEYAALRAFTRGSTASYEYAQFKKEHPDVERYISFYVLSSNDVTLGKRDSLWSLLLCVDGTWYQPNEIRQVELPQEYELIFGKRMDHFKTPYLVRFVAKLADHTAIITPTTQYIALQFRTFTKEFGFHWPLEQSGC